MKFVRWMNKKGISTDVLVVILLIIGLAIAAILFITFASKGKAGGSDLFNLTEPLKDAWIPAGD